MNQTRFLWTFTLLAATGLSSPLMAQDYAVADLDSGGTLSLGAAFRINELGMAAGLGVPAAGAGTFPVVWDGLGGTTVLPLLADHEAGTANDVSNTGIVVGESDDVVPLGTLLRIDAEAALWDGSGAVRLADLVTGGATLELLKAMRINERGQILGEARDASISALRAFVLDEGLLQDIGALTGTGNTEPFDMNERGQVVGCSEAALGVDHAFFWDQGAMVDLHDPSIMLGRCSTARAINEFGVIVGSADFIPGGVQLETACVWDHGEIISLGVLAGQQSYARDINDHGTIVGTSTVAVGGVHAFIYRDGAMEDLNDLIPSGTGWVLANAHSISNDGRIIGEGFNGGLRPFVLEPDCGGRFRIYGTGCAGSGGFVPGLWGQGCAASGGNLSIAVTNGAGGAAGALLFGAGTGSFTFPSGCTLQNLPLIPASLPLLLDGVAAGDGNLQLQLPLPGGIQPADLFLQAALGDTGGAGTFTLTQGLRVTFE